jgi:prophage antirepressor-like protein
MDNALQVFSYEGAEVRTVMIDGELWFVGKDVATVLGYKDTRHAIRDHVDPEDRRVLSNSSEGQNATQLNGGYGDTAILINESGLYSLILSSKLPTAKRFKHWVTSEVLPKVMRNGLPQPNKQDGMLAIEAASFMLTKAGIEGNQQVLALDKIYKRQLGFSMLETTGLVLEAPTKHQLLTPTEIGSQFGISARRVNEILAGVWYQYKVGEKWEPLGDGTTYAVMLDTGKKHSDGTPIRQLKWDSGILEQFDTLIEEAS